MLNSTPAVAPALATSLVSYTGRALLLGFLLPLFSSHASLAAQALADAASFDIGATVRLQGCVVEGERKGTYVFSRVTVWPAAASIDGIYGPRHFWLADEGDHMAGNVGRTIQLTGNIVEVRESEVERNPGQSSKGGRRVAIELPTGDIVTSIDLSGVGKADLESRIDMKITLVKVRVDSLLVVLPTCLPTFR